MAGSMESNKFRNPMYKYVAPAPPSELLDSSIFVMDFTNCKFIHVGLNSQDNFNVVVHIVTPSRFTNISPQFLKRIYFIMGDIFSFILDPPQKYRDTIFLDDELATVLKTINQGKNYLVLNSRVQEGCRVLLNRADLFALQNLERMIFESVERKTTFVRPNVLYQFNQTVCILAGRDGIDEIANVKDMKTYINNVFDQEIKIFEVPASQPSFADQFKMFSLEQFTMQTLSKRKTKLESEQGNCSDTYYSPSTTSCIDQIDMKNVAYYSPLSSPGTSYLTMHENGLTDGGQSMSYDAVYESPCYSHQTPPPPPPPEFSLPTQDENDGPSFYDLMHVTSPLASPTKFPDYYPEKAKHVYPGRQRGSNKSLFENMLYDE